MPYTVDQSDSCPASRPWACINKTTGRVMGCHPTRQAAQRQLAALMAKEGMTMTNTTLDARQDTPAEDKTTQALDDAIAALKAFVAAEDDPADKQKANRALAILNGLKQAEGTEPDGTSSASASLSVSERAVWTTAYMNNLPDSAFLYIAPGGSKDSEGKTTPRSLRYFPYKDANGAIDLPHLRNALSRIPQSTLPGAIKDRLTAKAQRILAQQTSSAKLDGLLRFSPAAEAPFELRDTGDAEMPTLAGYFARFDQWAEIKSTFEGNFLERIAAGAFKKTFTENRAKMRVLFQHGQDPQIGEKILGQVSELREDEQGAYYEVPLFDTAYNRDLLPALRANAYGSSFRFKVMQEHMDDRPERSEHNPDALAERTILEAKVMEFGPVTFPAYEGTTTGLRSATDWWQEQHLVSLLERLSEERAAAPLPREPAQTTRAPGRRTRTTVRDYLNMEEVQPPWRL